MATLAASFLEDLEDLEGEDLSHFQDADEQISDQEEIVDAVAKYWKSHKDTVSIVSDLARQPKFLETLEKVRELTESKQDSIENDESNFEENLCLKIPSSISNEEYDLVEVCNNYIVRIDHEICSIHRFCQDVYSKKFPELGQIVYSPLEYVELIKRIHNETDLTTIDLSDLLPSTVIMAVTVAASMTTGSALSPAELDKACGAADEALHLAQCRRAILTFLESRMSALAPNLSNIIGTALAARLITQGGGLLELARMPAQNIQLVGASRKSAMGFSTANAGAAVGILHTSDIVQSTPLLFRNRAIRLLSGKCSLAARVDSFKESPNGEVGQVYREHILQALVKSQEPPTAPQKKALPIPDEKVKSRRGGKRHRRMKEKYALGDVHKQANILPFGPEAEEEYGIDTGKGFGSLGKGSGLGKLKLQIRQQKVGIGKKRQQQLQRHGTQTASMRSVSSSGIATTAGFSSSLAFTPVQGIELSNPDATLASGTAAGLSVSVGSAEKYFDPNASFRLG